MSFLVLLLLIITLFYLTFNSGFNCAETSIEGVCLLTEEYDAFSTLLIIEVGFIAVFLILASYFQQYFMIDNKKEKVKVKKEKKRYTSIKAPKPLEEYVSPDLLAKEEKPKVKSTPIGVNTEKDELKSSKEETLETGTKPTPIGKSSKSESKPIETVKPSKDETVEVIEEPQIIEEEQIKPKKVKKEKRFKIKAKRGMALYELPSESDEAETQPTQSNEKIDKPIEEIVPVKTIEPDDFEVEETVVEKETIVDEEETVNLEETTEETVSEEDKELFEEEDTHPLDEEMVPEPNEQVLEESVSKLETVNEESIEEPLITKEEPSKKTKKPKSVEPKPITDLDIKPVPRKRTLAEKTAKRRTKSHTKEDISLVLESLTGLSKEDARLFIDTLIDIMSDALVKHDKIAIHQFGTFTCSKLKARTMQVPTKDEAYTEIPAHYVVRFKGSPAFFDYLNDGTDLPITAPEEITPSKKQTSSKKTPKIAITKTKDDLVESILSQCEVTPKEASLFMDTFINVVQETLEGEEKVALHQFGTFDVTKHKEKKMVIPNTQEEKIVPAHNVIKFKPSKTFTDQLNQERK